MKLTAERNSQDIIKIEEKARNCVGITRKRPYQACSSRMERSAQGLNCNECFSIS